MTWDNLVEKAIAYFEDHDDDYIETIEDLDNYNNHLDTHRYRSMLDLDFYFSGYRPSEIVDNVDKYFNTNDDYFYEDEWGIYYSSNTIDYSDQLDEYFISDLYDHKDDVDLPPYIEKLFTAYSSLDDDGEEDEDDEI